MTETVQAPSLSIGEVLDRRLIRPMYQPIVELSTRRVTGLEALARGPAGTALEFPDRLFAAARESGCLGHLDRLCSELALEHAIAAAVRPPLLFVNAEPAVLDQPLTPRLVDLLVGGLPFREVLEFTERALPSVPASMLRLSGLVERLGNSIALDDVGADPMSLAFLPILEPEVIKLDMSLVREPHAPLTRQVAAVVRAEALRTGALVIAEGIETEEDLAVARELGAHWGQGWLFGRPAPLDQVTHDFDPAAAEALRGPRPGFHVSFRTPFEAATAHRPPSAATPAAVSAGIDRLRDLVAHDPDTVVVVSGPDSGLPGVSVPLPELLGRARSLILVDDPAPGEFAAVVLGAGYGAALGVRGPDVLETADLPTVAAVARALLSRHGAG
ncbi:EAL domain-containing protein [Actinoplanes sp. NPDC051861]|uniref:EAL domain-containing protein n=1 Tax=Actinoplanes sp. NPDC051861 TaxID=3155170 RepID=UPI00344559D9